MKPSDLYKKTIIRVDMEVGKLKAIYFSDGSFVSLEARKVNDEVYVYPTYTESQEPGNKKAL